MPVISNNTFPYFFADPHWGHANIIQYENRPFSCIEEMDETLIERYNAVVKPDQACLWVGDAFLMPFEAAAETMKRLNGQKVLILGNHDRSITSMGKLGFISVNKELTFSIGNTPVRVNHYPYWRDQLDQFYSQQGFKSEKIEKIKKKYPPRIEGEILIHGHIHGTQRRYENMINVGVDAWDYSPVPIEEIEELIKEI